MKGGDVVRLASLAANVLLIVVLLGVVMFVSACVYACAGAMGR